MLGFRPILAFSTLALAAGCSAGFTIGGESHRVQVGDAKPFVRDPVASHLVPPDAVVVARGDGTYTYVASSDGTAYLFDENTGEVPRAFDLSRGDRLTLEHTNAGVTWTHRTGSVSSTGSAAPFGGPFRLYFERRLPFPAPTTAGSR